MIKFFTKTIFLLLFLIPGINYSQTTLIYFEDFEATDTTLINLNTTDVGLNSGPNQWIINNNYVGQPIFPNTISEDSTFGGLITHPDSNYLHIHDINVSSVSNANFDPNLASDRFTTVGPFCTLGDDSVHFAFFYLCVGDTNAYGQVYYKADTGAWTLANTIHYSGTYKWKYEDISDTAFSNHQSLEFGFRWINGGNTKDTTSSFAIDDIKLVGTYDPVSYPVKMNVSLLLGVPVCQNGQMDVGFTLSTPLCGMGKYYLELSGPHGDFSNPGFTGTYYLSNANPINYIGITIPSNSVPDSCYQIRITRTDVSPAIYSDTSACFTVKVCANTVTTVQPVVLFNPQDTICVGSVIDVPFYSSGVFINNKYIAQLSDSNGNFTVPINILGTFPSSQTYISQPGMVSGKIGASKQPIPPGCNYYLRVISTSPADTGNVFGPFCIRDCNIQTNNTNDFHVCLPPGIDTCFPFQVNHYNDSALSYALKNGFQVEIHSSRDFSVLNTGGLGGTVITDKDSCMNMDIPNLAFWNSLGLDPGVYYIRVIADSSNQPWNLSGTLIRLTVGSPYPSPLTVLLLNTTTYTTTVATDTTVCVNTLFEYELSPDNSPISTYEWTVNNNNQWGSSSTTGIIFGGAGVVKISVIETNYGCVGPGSDTIAVTVKGVPSVSITGPAIACLGDTLHYSVPLEDETYYTWSSATGNLLDTANNNLTIDFDSSGVQHIAIHALGECGFADKIKPITIKAPPPAEAGNDTTICQYTAAHLNTISGSYKYAWSTGATTQSTLAYPDTTTIYTVTVSYNVNPGCPASDSVTVFVKDAPITPLITQKDDTLYCRSDTSYTSYQWYADTTLLQGKTDTMLIINSGGNYNVKVTNRIGCSIAVGIFVVGLKEFSGSGQQFVVYPNPVEKELGIKAEELKIMKIDIYDLQGKIIYSVQPGAADANSETRINVSALSSGIYFVHIYNENESAVGRFIKE